MSAARFLSSCSQDLVSEYTQYEQAANDDDEVGEYADEVRSLSVYFPFPPNSPALVLTRVLPLTLIVFVSGVRLGFALASVRGGAVDERSLAIFRFLPLLSGIRFILGGVWNRDVGNLRSSVSAPVPYSYRFLTPAAPSLLISFLLHDKNLYFIVERVETRRLRTYPFARETEKRGRNHLLANTRASAVQFAPAKLQPPQSALRLPNTTNPTSVQLVLPALPIPSQQTQTQARPSQTRG